MVVFAKYRRDGKNEQSRLEKLPSLEIQREDFVVKERLSNRLYISGTLFFSACQWRLSKMQRTRIVGVSNPSYMKLPGCQGLGKFPCLTQMGCGFILEWLPGTNARH